MTLHRLLQSRRSVLRFTQKSWSSFTRPTAIQSEVSVLHTTQAPMKTCKFIQGPHAMFPMLGAIAFAYITSNSGHSITNLQGSETALDRLTEEVEVLLKYLEENEQELLMEQSRVCIEWLQRAEKEGSVPGKIYAQLAKASLDIKDQVASTEHFESAIGYYETAIEQAKSNLSPSSSIEDFNELLEYEAAACHACFEHRMKSNKTTTLPKAKAWCKDGIETYHKSLGVHPSTDDYDTRDELYCSLLLVDVSLNLEENEIAAAKATLERIDTFVEGKQNVDRKVLVALKSIRAFLDLS